MTDANFPAKPPNESCSGRRRLGSQLPHHRRSPSRYRPKQFGSGLPPAPNPPRCGHGHNRMDRLPNDHRVPAICPSCDREPEPNSSKSQARAGGCWSRHQRTLDRASAVVIGYRAERPGILRHRNHASARHGVDAREVRIQDPSILRSWRPRDRQSGWRRSRAHRAGPRHACDIGGGVASRVRMSHQGRTGAAPARRHCTRLRRASLLISALGARAGGDAPFGGMMAFALCVA